MNTAVIIHGAMLREGEVAALIESTIETHGRLDALVCSAAVHQRASIVDCSDDDWQQMLDVNVKGPFLCMKHALVHLAATGDGAVVLIGTAPDTAGAPDDAPYRATKAALVELARQAALEHESDAVRVNLVAPASTSADVADTVAFLLSDGARNISGAVIPVGVTAAHGRS